MQSSMSPRSRWRRRARNDGGDRAADHRAPDARAAFPDLERPERVVGEELVVGDHVVHAGADDSRDHDPDDDVRELLGLVTAPHPTHLGDPDRDENSDREHQPVHVQRNRAEVDDVLARTRDRGQRGEAVEDHCANSTGRPSSNSGAGRYLHAETRRWLLDPTATAEVRFPLCDFVAGRSAPAVGLAGRYFTIRERRRSASTLPPVWHCGQYVIS